MNPIFSQPSFIPYESCEGEWVTVSEFKGDKTFGYYICSYCQKTWMSAHSHKRFKQACKSCKRYFYAQYYWKNEYKVKKDIEQDKKALQDNLKHHMSDLCQACKKGVLCTGKGL